MAKLHIKKGDTVYILSGKDSGKKGKVLEVFRDRKVIVEVSISLQSMLSQPNQTFNQVGLLREAPSMLIR